MEEVVIAAQTNDPVTLRRCIEIVQKQAENPDLHKRAPTPGFQAACHAAAFWNHSEALQLLLDGGGCIIDGSKFISMKNVFSERVDCY
jgi:hypothetical protein